MCLSLPLQKCFTSCLDSATSFSCSFQMMVSIVCDARCYTYSLLVCKSDKCRSWLNSLFSGSDIFGFLLWEMLQASVQCRNQFARWDLISSWINIRVLGSSPFANRPPDGLIGYRKYLSVKPVQTPPTRYFAHAAAILDVNGVCERSTKSRKSALREEIGSFVWM